MPISRFAAGPVKEDTKRTTRSPNVQHWWRVMASNWIIHGETARTQSRQMLELWGSRTGVTSSNSYHCGMSCAACRRYPLCRPRAWAVRWIGGLCYDL